MTQPDYISGVMVTGPQRSGTRIASKILAQEMHLPWVPEEAIDFRDWRKLLWRVIDLEKWMQVFQDDFDNICRLHAAKNFPLGRN